MNQPMIGHPGQFNQGPRPEMIPGQGPMQMAQMPAFDPNAPSQDMVNALYDIFGSYPRKNVMPYGYEWNLTGADQLAANAQTTASIKVSADAAFNALYMTGTATGAYTLAPRTDSSDRQLTNDPVHSATAVGTAERPFILPKPLLLAPNTTISFAIQDLSGNPNNIYFTLWGFKVYRRQYAMSG